MTARVADAVTLAEAVCLMDPPMPLRTLQARVKRAESDGDIAHVHVRQAGPIGGRPAREYRASDLFALHRNWVLSTQGKKPPADGNVMGASGRMRRNDGYFSMGTGFDSQCLPRKVSEYQAGVALHTPVEHLITGRAQDPPVRQRPS